MDERVIKSFSDDYFFLSNFYPVFITYEGIRYPSVEHAYQAAKTDDCSLRLYISKACVRTAKKIGRVLSCRKDWDRLTVMLALLRLKFKDKVLRNKLLATEDAVLIEGNCWEDRFWGVSHGSGQNNLGKLLMQVREECKTDATTTTVAK